ncbi:hypothetical protein QWZ13_01225 [Reinekea marina]|nr:hypothetical protein [Reinekea marina]MDN3647524.1 hypothetical protein [Reinekea marina]
MGCGLRAAGLKLQAASCKLQAASCKRKIKSKFELWVKTVSLK